MVDYLLEWLQLLFRWVHVLAAIAWIGHAFLFHSLEEGLRAPEVDDVNDDVDGELWMVHGGGFFRLQKTRVLPQVFTGDLHWFKYEALFTWLSGFLLLIVLFYMGGAVLMVDQSVMDLSPWAAVGVGLGTLIGGWVIYDMTWATIGKTQKALGTAITIALVLGTGVALTQVLSGRAAFLHTGALMGTLMTANVWMRIIPGSKKMVASVERGEEPDAELGRIAHERSVHNGYMHFPIVFLMISNHYPATYGHEYAWLILIFFVVMGSAMRQMFYDGVTGAHPVVHAAVWGSLLGIVVLTAPKPSFAVAEAPAPHEGAAPLPDETGAVSGVVRYAGEVPEPKELTLFGGCESETDEPMYDRSLLVDDGKVKDAFVWVKTGWEDWQIPEPPEDAVEVDQRHCVYVDKMYGVRAGQPVTFVNSDPLFHNVRSLADDNETFNIMMPAKDQRETRTFRMPEVAVAVRCDAHPWMLSSIGVVPHDWWAITDDRGAFAISGLPPGEYTVEIWHQRLGVLEETVTIEADGRAGLDASYAEDALE